MAPHRPPREVGLLLAYVVVRLLQFQKWPACAEDAYITFRAARNWILTGAPVFNPQESSWPASSPLWTGWMTAGLWFHAQAEWWARIGSLAAEVLLLLAVPRMTNKRTAIAFGILLAGFQSAIALSLSGIEMFAMVAAFAWALLGSRVAIPVLMLSRPEGAILALVASWGHWRRSYVPLMVGAFGWGAMAWMTGQWLPAGVAAKVGTYGLHAFAGTKWLATMFWPLSGGKEQQSFAVLGLAALACLPFVRRTEPRTSATVFAVFGGLLLLAYWATGAVYFFWYMTLPMCAAMLIVASASSRWSHGWLLAVLVVASSWTTDYVIKRWDGQYQMLARLTDHLPHQGTVIMDAIGVTGWLLPDVRFVDVVGLSSPFSAKERAKHRDGWLTYLIQWEDPDAVVTKYHETALNIADAGDGHPFSEDRVYGGGKWVHQDSLGIAIYGFRIEKLGQDLILTAAR